MRQELGILGTLVVAALALGWFSGSYLPGALATLGLYTGWHLAQLLRLAHRVAARGPLRAPYPPGLWRPLYAGIERLRLRGRKHKRRLARYSDRFREAAAAMPDATVILNRDFRIDWANRAALELFGLRRRIRGMALSEAVPHPILQTYLKNGDFERPLEFNPPANKGLMLSLRLVPFGRKRQLLLVARDITKIYHIDQVRRDFVSNVSHELRTPLTVLNGFLETMLMGDNTHNPGQHRALELMHGQTARMQAIVSDLLTLSRLEFTIDTEHWQPVPVARLLSGIVDEARALSGNDHHQISLRADPELFLQGDRDEVRTAFSNLIFNAVRHTPPRARIDIRWQREPDQAVFTVADTGEGIAARHLARLSERFYRVDPGRSRKSGGTGLGLAIVKHVVNRHGGALKIASIVGKGSSFSCEFPIAPPDAKSKNG